MPSDLDNMKKSDEKLKTLCKILDEMLDTFSDNGNFVAWGKPQILWLLSKFFVYDNETTKLIIKYELGANCEPYFLL